jgi:ubiquinone/menaquinone biosynthesis C-methylase UbiE
MSYAPVLGHGMNASELAANPRLDRWFVQDLNKDGRLPLEDACLDAALCCVGVQYLQRPVAVFAEVSRALPSSSASRIVAFPPRQPRSGSRSTQETMQHLSCSTSSAPPLRRA